MAGTSSRTGRTESASNGGTAAEITGGIWALKRIRRIQKAGIPVAIAHLIRSQTWRFFIDSKRTRNISISAARSSEARECLLPRNLVTGSTGNWLSGLRIGPPTEFHRGEAATLR